MNLLYRALQLALFALPAALFIGLLHSAKLSKSNWVRTETALKRWWDIIAYALIADFILLTAYFVLTNPESPCKGCSKEANSSFVKTLSDLRIHLNNTLGNWFDVVLLVLVLIGVGRFMLHIRAIGPGRDIYAYLKYPPLTLSIWLAPIFAHLTLNILPTPKALNWLQDIFGPSEFSILALAFIATNFTFYSWRKPNISHVRILSNNLSQLEPQWSDTELLTWIQEEKPCEMDSMLFDQQHETERLIKLFDQRDSDAPVGKRIALEGPRGIGKSSIASKLNKYLCEENSNPESTENLHRDPSENTTISLTPGKWLSVLIDAWGRDQSSIEEQVLGLIIEKLSNHIDTFSLRNLPRVYSDAIKSLEGPLRLLDAFAPEYSAEDQLDKLHGIFDLLNLNLLLVIEDPDRNFNAQTLNQLTSLIDRFKPREHFRFNTLINYSISEINKKINAARECGIYERAEDKIVEIEAMDRICEHTVILSTIDCLTELNIFIEIWQKRALQCGAPFRYDNFPVRHVAPLKIKTPIDFKAILRHVDRLWQHGMLLGEIHLNDLIAICCLFRLEPADFNQLRGLIENLSLIDKIEEHLEKDEETQKTMPYGSWKLLSKDSNSSLVAAQKLLNESEHYRHFQTTPIDFEKHQTHEIEPQKIFSDIELKILPDRQRLACILRETPTPKNIPLDRTLISLFNGLLSDLRDDETRALKTIKDLLRGDYKIRFFSVYFAQDAIQLNKIDTATFNKLITIAISEMKFYELCWRSLFCHLGSITKRSDLAYLLAIKESVETDSFVKAAQILAGRVEANHSSPPNETIENIWILLVKALSDPERLERIISETDQIFEQNPKQFITSYKIETLIVNINALRFPYDLTGGIAQLLKQVFRENIEQKESIYTTLYECIIKGYGYNFSTDERELIADIEGRLRI